MPKMGLIGIKPRSGQGYVPSGALGENRFIACPTVWGPHIPQLMASHHSKNCFHHHISFPGSSASVFPCKDPTWHHSLGDPPLVRW